MNVESLNRIKIALNDTDIKVIDDDVNETNFCIPIIYSIVYIAISGIITIFSILVSVYLKLRNKNEVEINTFQGGRIVTT